MRDFATKDYAREKQSVGSTLVLSVAFGIMCAVLAWQEIVNFFGF